MNKTVLISSGVGVVSLAVGAVGGYLFSRREFNLTVEQRIDEEVTKVRREYSVMLMEARKGKPETPEKALDDILEDEDDEDQEEREETYREITTSYGGHILTQPKSDVRTTNPVAAAPPKPRDASGRFAKTKDKEAQPELISMEEYAENPWGYPDLTVRYFYKNGTLLTYADVDVDIEQVGQKNLDTFDLTIPEEVPNTIVVVNHNLSEIYVVELHHGDLSDENEGGGELLEMDEIDDFEDLDED